MKILFVTPYLPGPPIFGGQRRIHGLLTELAGEHEISVVALVDGFIDHRNALKDTQSYCRNVIVVPDRWHRVAGGPKRILQLGSLLSTRSWERMLYRRPAFQRALDRVLTENRYDIVCSEFVFMAYYKYGAARKQGARLVLDEHNIEYDILRRSASSGSLDRKLFNALNWRKLRREEVAAWRRFDGCTVTSVRDLGILTEKAPELPAAVIPNGVNVTSFRPTPGNVPEPMTLLFFGAMNYYPNTDAAVFFTREILPLLSARYPSARLRIVGPVGPGPVMDLRGDRVEIVGMVDDLRTEIERAAVVVAPLRIGGGTRLKILEAMAFAKPIVTTTIGAEGIDVAHDREVLVADTPSEFARAIGRILDDPALGQRLGSAARQKAEARYSWRAAAHDLVDFYRRTMLAAPRA